MVAYYMLKYPVECRPASTAKQQEINNIHKWANSDTNGAKAVEYGSFDFGGIREHKNVGLVHISKIFGKHGLSSMGQCHLTE